MLCFITELAQGCQISLKSKGQLLFLVFNFYILFLPSELHQRPQTCSTFTSSWTRQYFLKNQGLTFPNFIRGKLEKSTSNSSRIYLKNTRITYLKSLHLFHRYQAPWCATGKLLLTVADEFQARVPGYHLFSVSEERAADC